MVWRISAQAESKPTSKIFSGIKLPIADARSQARRRPGPKLLMGPLRRFGGISWQGRVERRLGAVLSVIRLTPQFAVLIYWFEEKAPPTRALHSPAPDRYLAGRRHDG